MPATAASGTAVTSLWRNVRDRRASDAEPRAAMRIGTRDVGVGGHPVVRIGHALFRGKKRQQRGERIQRERLAVRESQVFTLHREPVAFVMAAHHRTLGGDDLHSQVVQLKRVVHQR